ncbi:MAG: ferric reductase-like transmembrane domain-containing protein [Chloroflexi bacterium]|nr:ferric reductase-like transmembrane domain-containing protein [Chloroflexota bacterium]MCI0578396.1 ferric reductase-like transmembrane domain-containing protein [Chloroflexota bacterium]MCI0647607.1 ferric reductase-like transmembrane domain-containing protein [Chloroflexota bacterium]MCI0730424.1 ferric reductase-like transmembrane domain-containing protein [Chloroflexota bacterium]
MNVLWNFLPREKERWLTHVALALATLVWMVVTFQLMPGVERARILAGGTGYLALLLLALTLLIGPWQLLRARRKRNPVNINLRRDIGIWTGLVGAAHVVFGFMAHLQGRFWLFFVEETPHGFRPLLNSFGISNYAGLLATLILLMLLFLSNDLTLRWLKGKLWKNLQRFNYGLFVLTLVHTILYQALIQRNPAMRFFTLALTMVAIVLQLAGFFFIRSYTSIKPV